MLAYWEPPASISTSKPVGTDPHALPADAPLACRDLLGCHRRGPRDRRLQPVPPAAVLLIGGAILLLPASLYLTATPRFQFVGLVPVACLLLGAYAVRNRVWVAGLLVAGAVVF